MSFRYMSMIAAILCFPLHSMAQQTDEILAMEAAGTVYVDASLGEDSKKCGEPDKPCATLGRALSHARTIQSELVGVEFPLVSIEVAAGDYEETLLEIRSGWIRFVGAGTGATVVSNIDQAPVTVRFAQPVAFQHMTLIGPYTGGWGSTLEVKDGAYVHVDGCEFRDSDGGVDANNATAVVTNSSFTNNGAGANAINNAYLALGEVTIVGRSEAQGGGVSFVDNSVGSLSNISITSTNTAVFLLQSEAYGFRGIEIFGNFRGFELLSNSYLEVSRARIAHNSESGLRMWLNSSALIQGTEFSNNDTGVFVFEDSFVDLRYCTISNSTTGVSFDYFGRGALWSLTFVKNGQDIHADHDGKFYEIN